jgi:hypothetical protein
MCLLGACSSSGPEITGATISDGDPVVGQRVLLRVYAKSDNPPLRYIWSGSGGVFQSSDDDFRSGELTDQYSVYWIPTSPGNPTIRCTVVDDEDEDEIYEFPTEVGARTLEDLEAEDQVVLMTKNPRAMIGGIMAAIQNHNIMYYSATDTLDYDWGESYFDWSLPENPLNAMIISSTSSYYYTVSYVWAVYKNSSDKWKIVVRGSSDDENYDCDFTIDGDNPVTKVNKIGVNGTVIWVGTDNGLYAFSSSGETWSGPVELEEGVTYIDVKDIYVAHGFIYVATPTGIYFTEDNGGTWEKFNDTWDTKVLTAYYDINNETVRVYALTEEGDGSATYTIRCFNKHGDRQTAPGYPPDSYDWIESLDTDPLGNLWFGKWTWNADDGWENPGNIDDTDDHIVRSTVSPEGLVYLLTATGELNVWGKKED